MNPQQPSLDDDLSMLMDTLDEVLRASSDLADERYQEVKAQAEKALKEVQHRLSGRSECYITRAKALACCTDSYVRNKPWCSVGIGATVGLIFGLLLARR